MEFEQLLLFMSILLLFSVLISKISHKFGVPVLLCFLGIGMLAGSEGPGGIFFNNARFAQSMGVTALIFILFSGGLDTEWREVRPALPGAISLATVGVLLTTLLVGAFAAYIMHISLLEGMLFGAIISSTDAAAVFSVLRTKELRLHRKLAALLELESGSNDPMAVFLTIGLTNLLVNPAAPLYSIILLFFQQMIVGLLGGLILGRGSVLLINQLHLEVVGLYPVLTIALVLFIYGITTVLNGSGFLAVYIAGILIGNSRLHHNETLSHFHEGLAWLMQVVMFLTLGLLVFPSRLAVIAVSGVLIVLFLIFVARPVSVLASLIFTRIPIREKLFVSWVGLRGAVPIVLATFPLIAGETKAQGIFNEVFFVVVVSVLLQGTSLPFVARKLRVVADEPELEVAA